jgi:hypothetical protein
VKCLTFRTSKLQLITLSRTVPSRGRARTAASTWSEEIPFVLLGLGAQPREDTGLSPAETVFGAQIVLPNEFFQNDELLVDTIVKNFSETLHVSAPSLPRHNSSTDLPSELPAELLSTPLIWVRRGGLVPPLQPLYDGPYTVLSRGPRSFTIRVGSRDEMVAVSRLKACTSADATPGSLRRRGRPPGLHPGGPAATKRVSFSDLLVSSPPPLALPRDGPGTVFQPGEEVFASPGLTVPSLVPQTRYPSRNGHRAEVRPLTSSPSGRGQSSGGALWTPAYTPGWRSDQSGVLQQHWTVHVQCLYISCYVTLNKPVLSYLLSRLLPQFVLLA